MNLQGRNLSAGTQGDDVRLLHRELRQLGFDIKDNEFREAVFGDSTREAVQRFQERNRLAVSGVVDPPTATLINARVDAQRPLVVRGRVQRADGSPLVGASVSAYDRDLRSEELLGQATTDQAGRYEIRYAAEQFRRAEKGAADLRVAVSIETGRELASSPLRFNAGADETIDLTLGADVRGPSEWDRGLAVLEPVLAGVPLAEVKEDQEHHDITFLAGDTGLPQEQISMLARAAQEAARPFDPANPTPAPAFYGWFRQGLPMDRAELLARSTDTLLAALKKAIDDNIVPANLRDQLDRIKAVLDQARSQRLLKPRAGDGPAALGDVLQLLTGEEVLTLDQARKFALLRADARPGEDFWGKIGDIGLSAPQLAGVQRGLVLNEVVGGDPKLLHEAQRRVPNVTIGETPSSVLGIAAMGVEDWHAVLKAVGPSVVDDSTVAAQARELTRRVAELMPNEFLLVRAARRPHGDVLSASLAQLGRLQELNGRDILRKAFDDLNTDAIPPDQRPVARAAFGDLQKLANAYPGLKLHEVLTRDGAITEKVPEITRRVALVEKVFALNPEADFLGLDYLPDSPHVKALKFDGIDEGDKTMVLNTVKAYQRAYRAAGDALRAKEIVEAGFHSATAIARLTLDGFAEASGLGMAEAYRVHENAKDLALDAGLQFMAIYDLLRRVGHGDKHPVNSVSASPAVGSYLRRLDGFEDMFGRQATCRCQHCQSVLSPAAYFVDLMRFIDDNVTTKVFVGPKANHALKLKSRRPDLWTLELTCENTDTLIPYLDIINEVLEDFIAKDFTPRPIGRPAIQKAVYGKLATAQDSFEQPLVLPLRRIEAYLSHFDRIRADVARALGVDQQTQTRARLGLSLTEWNLITTPRDSDQPFLTRLYGSAIAGGLTPANRINVQDLLKTSRWTREELGQLFATQFVRAGGTITIAATKSGPDAVQNDIEVVSGLTLGVLDRLHRFTRLRRKLPWDVSELDLVLVALKTGTSLSLGGAEANQIARLLDIQARFSILAAESCALFTTIPTTAVGKQRSLFDRLFNLEPFVSQDGVWPQNQPFTHPAQGNGTSQPDNRALQRILAGLQVADQELVQLIEGLGLSQPFPLTINNLTLLYRHARLARLLKLSVPELFQLIRLGNVGPTGGNRVATWTDLNALLDVFDRWKATGFSLDDVGFITRGRVLKPATYPDVGAVAKNIADAVRADRAVEFADTVFSQLPNVTEAHSRQIVADNPSAFEELASGVLRLRRNFNPQTGTLSLPAGVTAAVGAVRALLYKFHPRGILPGRIAAQLAVGEGKVRALSALLGNVLDGHDPDVVSELQAGTGPTPKLEATVQKFLPLAVLFRSAAWDETSLQFVLDNPATFSLSVPVDPSQLSTDAAFKVAAYVRWATVGDTEFTPEKAQPDADAVRQVLQGGFTDNVPLGKALRVPTTQVAALKPHIVIDASKPFEALDRLGACLVLSTYLGVSGETLKLIVPTRSQAADEYADLAQAAEGLYGVIRVKYPDERTFLDKVDAYEDTIRGVKRDGLVEYLIRSANQGFASVSDLYQYFLLDTQLEGCARTSRVVAANASLQLYVNRILMNLEQDALPASDPNRVHVKPGLIPDEWTWRQHYRVWEANRKVFLYPENYLEPELRDDKTPLFEDLESTLLQQTINEQNVTDAYANYLAGFAAVSNLQIAGAYHQRDSADKRDVLHLLGATVGEPPTYYYRTIENFAPGAADSQSTRRMKSTPWRKLNVQIPTRIVSPIAFGGRLYLFWAETNSQVRTSFVGGTSREDAYTHKITIRHAESKLDGSWTAPQVIGNPRFEHATFVLETATTRKRLAGFPWDRVYPGVVLPSGATARPTLYLIGMGSGGETFQAYGSYVLGDVFDRETTPGLVSTESVSGLAQSGPSIYRAVGDVLGFGQRSAVGASYYQATELLNLSAATRSTELVRWAVGPDVQILNGSPSDGIIDVRGDIFVLQEVVPNGELRLRRIGTTVAEQVAMRFAAGGLGDLLSVEFQERLEEAPPPVDRLDQSVKDTTYDPARKYTLPDGTVVQRPIDFGGIYGVYFREIFFHIPFLIANHLNSQQRFAASQRWYHYVFDPTSADIDRDRVWRYQEFRGRTPDTLRRMLTDDGALAAYREDPFNPHAIARVRLTAYQKAIVMKYIDNLLDWGDTLFAEFTMESVNEATMLYVMAADILGPRPPQVGECGEGDIHPKTYEKIEPLLGTTSDFLIEMEHLPPSKFATKKGVSQMSRFTSQPAMATRSFAMTGRGATGQPSEEFVTPPVGREAGTSYWRTTGGIDLRNVGHDGNGAAAPETRPITGIDGGPDGRRIAVTPDPTNPGNPDILGKGGIPAPGGIVPFDYTIPEKLLKQPGLEPRELDRPMKGRPKFPPVDLAPDVARSTPVFCVPENTDLLAYWDRVEDRLYKIRNCMDITGARRQLPLFAPEIDPRLLVRARAAGLSLDDVLSVTNGNVPPYRFSFLIEKAKQSASTVQSLGAALLSALEKKDVEELSRLRTVHEQNILKLRSRIEDLEIEAGQDAQASLERQRDTAEYRKSYYDSLVQTGLTPWERTEQVSRHTASALHATEAILGTLAGTFNLLPQLGSPFAMKYGGVEVGNSFHRFSVGVRALAELSEVISAAAGLEATFQRRDDEWKNQRTLADKELASLEKQIDAAKIRVDIAKRSVEIHDKTVAQSEEVFEFYRDKFSNLGLYTFLSTQLHRLYREGFNAAYAMAKMAEQAYRFERPEDTATLLSPTPWDASHAGLLAGERLLLDLENLERRFLETNYRTLEVEQAFSLRQFDPSALVKLQQTGECDFSIPEIFFDLAYPGQYRRRIKAVRLTIPCVTGHYVNVGATLRLKSSDLRFTSALASTLQPVPLRHTTAIAASTADNDAGVFEFSFRDERYMPFEGAGAISAWHLALPKNFRPFDYQTISDVILRIAYTAEEDDALRGRVEDLTGTLAMYLSNTGVDRLFSLRHEFPDAWYKLIRSPLGTAVDLTLSERHLPFFISTHRLGTASVALLLKTGDSVANVQLEFDDTLVQTFSSDGATGLPGATVGNVPVLGKHSVKVRNRGQLGPGTGTSPATIDEDKLSDILLRFTLKTSA